jgi:hypothetical protein
MTFIFSLERSVWLKGDSIRDERAGRIRVTTEIAGAEHGLCVPAVRPEFDGADNRLQFPARNVHDLVHVLRMCELAVVARSATLTNHVLGCLSWRPTQDKPDLWAAVTVGLRYRGDDRDVRAHPITRSCTRPQRRP